MPITKYRKISQNTVCLFDNYEDCAKYFQFTKENVTCIFQYRNIPSLAL